MRQVIGSATIAAALLASTAARAETPAEAIGIVYTAPETCITADEFFAQLRARAQVRRSDTLGASERTFEIAIEDTPAGVRGVLAIRTARGLSTREVTGSDCRETVSALVVVAALAIVTERATARPAPAVDLEQPVPPRARPAHRPRIEVGSGLALVRGVLPEGAFALPVYVAFGRARGPRVRIGGVRTRQEDLAMTAGDTAFRWTAGRIDVAPRTLALGAIEVAPALGIEAGALEGRGTDVALPARSVRPWLAPDLAVRIRVVLGRVAMELEGALAVPLVRDRFFIAPGTTVHQSARVTAGVGLTLAVGLW